MKILGRHILAEFYNCNKKILDNVEQITKIMNNAANEAKATIVSSNFHHFNPYGVSGVVVIAESHLTIHTWPEYGYAAVDIFTCGTNVDPHTALDVLKNSLQAKDIYFKEMNRGKITPDKILIKSDEF